MQELCCQDISHSYDGERDAVAGLHLQVRGGEVLGLIGPNGAGKSTTLRILATLQKADRGRVSWDGEDAWEHRHAIRPKIGFLGDGTALYPTMSAAGYLNFFADLYGLDDAAARERVGELLELFDLSPKAEAKIADLSKGMRQRLAIARTMVQRPELLLLDEPADGLDPLGRRRLREILKVVAKDGVAIVVSSHILRELDGFCDTVALIQKGRLQLHGSVEEVIERYEVGRRVYELQLTAGLQIAVEILRRHEGLIESVEPLHAHASEGFAPESSDRGRVLVRMHGDERRPALILRELVEAGAELISMARLRSDLEDVYQSLGRDEVS